MSMALSAAVRRVGGALHPALVLAAIVLAAFLLPLPTLLGVADWQVMTDELLYTKLALAVGDNLSPAPRIHGEPYPLSSQLYPVLLAPIMALFDIPTAFKLAHVLNGLLMASTAIPVYLLARSAAFPRVAAYAVAALSVFTPWVLLGVVVWQDPVSYPAFAWALAAMQRALVAPSARNDLLAIGALALAFFARTQFALLAIVFPVVLVLHHVGFALADRGRMRPHVAAGSAARALVREHRVLLAIYAVAALAVIAIVGGSGRSLLGAYSGSATGDLVPSGIVHFAGEHLAAVAVGIAVVPLVLALGWAVPTLVRPDGRERHALAVLALVVTPAVLLQVTSFTLRFTTSGGHHDRYAFYVVPLLFAGMVACLLEGRRRWPFVLAAGLVVVPVLGTLTYEPGSRPPIFVSPPAVFWTVWEGQAYRLGQVFGVADLSPQTALRWGSLLAAAALAAGLFWLPRRVMAPAVVLLVLVFCAAETRYVLTRAPLNNSPSGPEFTNADWIDDALPDGAEAGLVPVFAGNSEFEAQRIWWPAEFWNKDVTATFQSNRANPYTPFAAETMTVDPAQGTVESSKVMDHLVVARGDLRFRLAGPTLAEAGHLQLIRPDRPYRVSWTTQNLVQDGWTLTGNVPTLRLFDLPGEGPGRRVSVRMWATPEVLSARRYTLSDGRRRSSGVVNLGEEVTGTLTTCVPAGGTTDVRLRIRGSNALSDGREVGLRVMGIAVEPVAAGDCPA